jgi:3-hydroxybutyryl-CoA dehydratase
MVTHLGGLWAFLATGMHFEFLGPVYVGDTITATAEVIEVDPEKSFVRLRVDCVNAEGKAVLRGEVSGFPGLHEE